MIADELMRESMALPVEERLELARPLLESAEPTTAMTAQADDSQAVIERRAEEVRTGTATMIPASDVFQRLALIAPDHPWVSGWSFTGKR